MGYFVLGSYHNYTTYGATGWDMIPHRDMWRDLPWVISDLFRCEFSASSLIHMIIADYLDGDTARGGSRSGYSSLG